MKKITLFALGAFFYSNCAFAQPDLNQIDLNNSEVNQMKTTGTLYTPPEGSLFLENRTDLYSFYESLEKYGMISVAQDSNIAKIEGYVFLNNFEYEVDILGIAISIIDICSSKDKISTAKSKIEKWQDNLLKNVNNKNLYKDEEYIKFVKLFSSIFFETTSDKLAKFDSVEFDLKLVYIDPDSWCTKTCQKLLHYIALASDKVTTIQELFVKNSYIKGKYKFTKNSATDYEITPIE